MKAKKKGPVAKDSKKESVFRGISAALQAAGFTVRREKLKAGPGWKVVSGACRAADQKFIFIDPRMTQDDQILFLRARAAAVGVQLPPEEGAEVAAGTAA